MKKSTKGLLSALLLTAMCGAVGCDNNDSSLTSTSSTATITSSSTKEEVVTHNFLEKIIDGGDQCYTATYADGKTTLDFKKATGKGWASAKVDLTNVANKDKMSTLRFKVSGVGKLILKFEGTGGAAEVQLLVYDTVSSYEWNLLEDTAKVKDAHSLFIFAAAGGEGEGSLTFEELTLTSAVAGDDASYQIIPTNYANFSKTAQVYDGVSDKFHFNANWISRDEGTYEFTYNEGVTTVEYAKDPNEDRSWTYAYTEVAGDFSNFNYINFKVNGPQSKAFTLKVTQSDLTKTVGSDMHFNFSGKEDVFSLDISKLSAGDKNLIGNVLFFVDGGSQGTSGTFTISQAYFSKEMPSESRVNKFVTGDEFSVNKYWAGDSIFNITEASDKTTVSWTGAINDNRWSNVFVPYDGDVSEFGEISYNITLPAHTGVRLTIQDGGGNLGDLLNLENDEAKTFTGTFSLAGFTKEQLAGTSKVMMFPLMSINDAANVEAGEQKEFDVPTSGTIEINELKFKHARSIVDATTGVVDVKTANWFGAEATTTVTSEENGAKISYTNGSWDTVKFRIDPEVVKAEEYTKVTIKFTGIEGRGTILKLETETNYSGVEAKYLGEKDGEGNPTDLGLMTGTEQTAELDITALNDNVIKFMVFTEPTQSADLTDKTGNIVIHSITFSK